MRAGSSASARRALAAIALALAASACAGVSFRRDTETSGTFTSYGVSFTLLSTDFPKTAMQIARENASDANLANLEVDRAYVFPSLGPFDWILDIVSVRYARITGTWGFPGR